MLSGRRSVRQWKFMVQDCYRIPAVAQIENADAGGPHVDERSPCATRRSIQVLACVVYNARSARGREHGTDRCLELPTMTGAPGTLGALSRERSDLHLYVGRELGLLLLEGRDQRRQLVERGRLDIERELIGDALLRGLDRAHQP
jgi:hypothetical protein